MLTARNGLIQSRNLRNASLISLPALRASRLVVSQSSRIFVFKSGSGRGGGMRWLRQSPRGSRARRLGSHDPLDLLDVGLHARGVAAHLTERRLGVGHPRLEPGDTVIESMRQPVGGLCAALHARFDTGHALVQSEYFL